MALVVDGAAVAHDGDAVADPHHLVHAVRDVEDGAAGSAQLPDHRKQPFGFLAGQGRGRLVHDEDRSRAAAIADQRAGDADQHLVAGATAAPSSCAGRCRMMPQPGERFARAAVDRLPVDQGAEPPRIGLAEKHVLGHRQLRNDVQFLVDEAQPDARRRLAGCRAGPRRRRSRSPRVSARDDAGQDLDQRRSCRRRSRPSARGPRRPSARATRRPAPGRRNRPWRRWRPKAASFRARSGSRMRRELRRIRPARSCDAYLSSVATLAAVTSLVGT